MAKSIHARAIDDALDMNDQLGALFDRLGASSGGITAAYRTARLALSGRLDQPALMQDVLQQLRRAVIAQVDLALRQAQEKGLAQAERNLSAYRLRPVVRVTDATAARNAALSALDMQLNGIYAMAATGRLDESEILGDDARAGLLTPGPVAINANRWVATVAVGAFLGSVAGAVRSGRQDDSPQVAERDAFYKQWVATIDERTTDCCLEAHGQTRRIDEAFTLTGTPRYADEVDAPPGHWNCRAALALVHASDVDDSLTNALRGAARDEQQSRAAGERETTAPSNALRGR